MVLKPSEAEKFYDHFGKKQDSQGFYEDKAINDLIAHAGFREAGMVFEFGCGTGRFAEKLLTYHLPDSAIYLGYDVSATMVALARRRLGAFATRAQAVQSDGTIGFPIPDNSFDRVVSTYVLDLLSETDIHAFFHEAHRLLNPTGKLCLISLTRGVSLLSRIVIFAWGLIFRTRPSLLGGCRPIQLTHYLETQMWQLAYRRVIAAFGIPSEVLVVAAKKNRQA